MMANEGDTVASPPGLSADAQIWMAESLLSGIDAASVAASLIRQGFGPATTHAGIAAARGSPLFAAAWRTTQRLRKLESLLAIRHALALVDQRTARVERRARLSRAQFQGEYYAANRPVVLTGLLEGSAALERWTPEYLEESCGDALVEVMSGRDANPFYEIWSEKHRTSMTLSAYVQNITTGGAGNDLYLVANNGFFDRPSVAVLREEVPTLPQYLDPTQAQGKTYFWFGPAGTVTPLHHDVMNVLLVQITGRKRFTLISPDQTPWVYNTIGVYSDVDCEAPDLERHQLFRNTRALTVELQPGEILFIPVGWWHHVRALDLSMTITYTNFVFPNDFHWSHPMPS